MIAYMTYMNECENINHSKKSTRDLKDEHKKGFQFLNLWKKASSEKVKDKKIQHSLENFSKKKIACWQKDFC